MAPTGSSTVEHGLIDAPEVPLINRDRLNPMSRYAPLQFPYEGPVSEKVATLEGGDLPSVRDTAPVQFVMMLGNDLMRLVLDVVDDVISLTMDADAYNSLVELVNEAPEHENGINFEYTSGDCRDVVIGYRLFGRPLGGSWVQYLHGPLTFRCMSATEADSIDDSQIEPGGMIKHQQGGPFDGNFSPAFLATTEK
jgi:hypothetical protein